MLQTLRRKRARREVADRLYTALVERARLPVFFEELRVPDTMDGRLDILLLHAWLALEKLGAPETRDLAQLITDRLFTSFDEALRELGASDTGVSRRIKHIADAFYGRMDAYRKAEGEEGLAAAILRNIYRGDSAAGNGARRLARYALAAQQHLTQCDPEHGALDFGPAPAVVKT